MLANYIVLMNERLADTTNFPDLKTSYPIREQAMFFWRKSAIEYQEELINSLIPSNFHVEVRKI